MTSNENITLCGSSDIIIEFFEYCINSDERVQNYISGILEQVKKWIESQSIKKLILAIMSKDKNDVLERWQFDIQIQNDSNYGYIREKNESQIQNEIQTILRQLSASISYLPVLEVPCTFKVLAYTNKNADVPKSWVDSDPKYIKHNQEQVNLRSFSTPYHSVGAMVSYRFRDY
ncbi:DNA-binding protein [Anaeromyces robustus]|uniref:DNA-binding protein n=1 Tax=Anaeromyces robustus TaxID=1754192 RepID=A0A1Y1X583_9FUNG|nr:DNA-binding protein [Anaeromyces robustus]|eukprot:ORX80862.1 DNA-binding protein [Anaeromyces robustus]